MDLDHYRLIKAKCPIDLAMLKYYNEHNRVYDFFYGYFHYARVQSPGKKEKVLGINKVMAMVRSEECRRGLMLETPNEENLAMISSEASSI